ncbi:glycosyltransferase [Paenibacillus tianjinensis]|uniref:Glycosyltransferase n=1 Tax=Paenibacillus tianjinensis TaxID=2810347 RepID=A0ABX7LBI7_9BACL|nr:glycosyltransferase [Paenibacillus tianjinensis]QSF44114.1 glycosyltransferase [Paenibacillus tianjinensis]
MSQFSVLMSIYLKEIPEHFEKSLNSIIDQTLKPSQIVIVKDGPLTKELNTIIDEFKENNVNIVKVVNLKDNVGLGEALRVGLNQCDYELVARMDSDDICRTDRFEKQIMFMEKNLDISVMGSWIAEFEREPNDIISVRNVPLTHEEIIRTAKIRNPMNHMSVIFRKKDVINAGNYQSFLWNEDYYLWVRMLVNGYKFANISEVLLDVRTGQEMFKRRGGLKYFFVEIKLQRVFIFLGLIGKYVAVKNITKRLFIRLLPSEFRAYIYKRYLRNSNE